MASNSKEIVSIVGDGAIAATGLGEGRLIPVVIIDCSKRRDIEELIANHQETPPGDVYSRWGVNILFPATMYLHLEFLKPAKVNFYLPFNIKKNMMLIEGIHISRGLYIQPTSSGLKVGEGIDAPKILIEIPPETKLDRWDKYALDVKIKKFRAQGLGKKEAREAAEKLVSEVKRFWLSGKF